MNFENCEAFVVPFSVQKASVWKKVIKYLSEKETTPVEAICNSRVVSIDKEYYPVERLEIDYIAQWNAISIFKERWTEQETHYEREVHYFDRFGKEHKNAGFDYFDTKSGKWKSGALHPIASSVKGYSGNPNTRPWEPKEVTVAVTENIPYERETGRKWNSGEIKGNHIYHHNREYPFSMLLKSQVTDILSSIIYDSKTAENEKIPYTQEAIKDGTVIKQSEPLNESDFESELSKAKSAAKTECTAKIPGQEYAGFRMEFDFNEICQIWYYPVYHVIYEFKGQKYECFVSGYWKGSSFLEENPFDHLGLNLKGSPRKIINGHPLSSYQKDPVIGKHDPEDTSIESIKWQYDNHCSKLEDKKKKSRLNYFWIWLGFGAAYTYLMINDELFPSLIVLIGIVVCLGIINHKNIKNIEQEIAENEEAKNNVVPLRQAKKQAIMKIVLDDNLSDSEKAMRCGAILKRV